LKYFLDACISNHFASSLREFGEDVEHLNERYKKDPGDKIWIPEICKEGRIIITCDLAQTKVRGKTAVECRLYQRHRGIAYFLPRSFSGWLIWRQAAVFFRCWEAIVTESAAAKRGELFDVSDTGKIAPKHIRKVN
jgi:hypothetical protein